MIQFPVGFDVSAFASEIFLFAAPFIAVFFIIAVGLYIKNVLERSV